MKPHNCLAVVCCGGRNTRGYVRSLFLGETFSYGKGKAFSGNTHVTQQMYRRRWVKISLKDWGKPRKSFTCAFKNSVIWCLQQGSMKDWLYWAHLSGLLFIGLCDRCSLLNNEKCADTNYRYTSQVSIEQCSLFCGLVRRCDLLVEIVMICIICWKPQCHFSVRLNWNQNAVILKVYGSVHEKHFLAFEFIIHSYMKLKLFLTIHMLVETKMLTTFLKDMNFDGEELCSEYKNVYLQRV